MKDHGSAIQRVYERYIAVDSLEYRPEAWAEFKAVIREQYTQLLSKRDIRVVRLVSFSPDIDCVRERWNDRGELLVYEIESLCAGHPLADRARGLTHNQMFRAVHDYFGHLLPGNDTSVDGELKAYVAHARMFASAGHVLSLDVLTAETLGQVAAYVVEGGFAEVQVPRTMSWEHERLAKYLGV